MREIEKAEKESQRQFEEKESQRQFESENLKLLHKNEASPVRC